MRIPKVNHLGDKNIKEETITIDDFTPFPFYYEQWQDDEKAFVKLIKKIESMIRKSYEYKNYIEYLKNELDMNQCSFFKKLSREDVRLEIHHSPLTLFDITCIVFNKYATLNNGEVDIYAVADEVTKLHYENKVGLIPLSLTVHKLVHNGELFIPVDIVFGNLYNFYEKYKTYFSSDQIILLKENIRLTKQINKDKYLPSILERKFTYLNIEGIELPSKFNVNKKEIS